MDEVSHHSKPDARSGQIRTLLAGGHFLFRQAVRAALDGENDIVVVDEAGTEDEALGAVDRTRPDVVVMDATLGSSSAVSAIARVTARIGGSGVVFIATSNEPPVVDVIEAGARAYLSKDASLAELIGCVRGVHGGDVLIPPRLLGSLLTDLLERRRDQRETFALLDRLTPRERQVLVLLADDADNRSIARALSISDGTAKTHVQNVLAKLGVHSRTEAAAFVRRTDLLRTRMFGLAEPTTAWRGRSIGSLPRAYAVNGVSAPIRGDGTGAGDATVPVPAEPGEGTVSV